MTLMSYCVIFGPVFRPNPVFSSWVQLGTRHILETMTKAGHDITTLFLCGGLSKNPLFVQIYANTTGMLWKTRNVVSFRLLF